MRDVTLVSSGASTQTPVGLETIERLQGWMRGIHVLVLGSGASADYGYPLMGPLGTHLMETMAPASKNEAEWNLIIGKLRQGVDLETALAETRCSDGLINDIVAATWKYVSTFDLEFYRKLTEDNEIFPLSQLLKWLDTARRRIDIVTTNYDRVIEYACDAARITWLDGTGFGYFRQGMRTMDTIVRDDPKGPPLVVARIWKVHGSLDWFSGEADSAFTARSLRSTIPAKSRPLIVTPGQAKYERAFEDPFRTTLAGADTVLKDANSFLCVGYGFNDKHVHAKLLEKAKDPQSRFIVAARSLTTNAKHFLLRGACKNFIAIEGAASQCQSLIWQSNMDDPITVPGNLWSVSGLLATVT
jgi:hypothetical protein